MDSVLERRVAPVRAASNLARISNFFSYHRSPHLDKMQTGVARPRVGARTDSAHFQIGELNMSSQREAETTDLFATSGLFIGHRGRRS